MATPITRRRRIGRSGVWAFFWLALFSPAVLRAQAATKISPPSAAQSPVSTYALTGTVLNVIGRPMPDVEVYIAKTERRTRTDERGRWRIVDPPPGAHVVVARSFGYVPYMREVIIGATGAESIDLILRRYPTTLSQVEVRAQSNRSAMEADIVAERLTQLKATAGRLFTRAYILEQRPYSMAELIQGVPGIVVRRVGDEIVAQNARAAAVGGSGCTLQWFLDITPITAAGVTSLDPLSVRSVEVYPQPVMLPGLPAQTDRCGAIVINSLRR